MSPRELVILILGLAIVAVILRGLYVAIRARRGQIRLAIDKEVPTDLSLEELELAELPNGGARIKVRDLESASHRDLAQARSRADSMDLSDNQDSHIPVLMDVVEVNAQSQSSSPSDRSAASVGAKTHRRETSEEPDSVAFTVAASKAEMDPDLAAFESEYEEPVFEEPVLQTSEFGEADFEEPENKAADHEEPPEDDDSLPVEAQSEALEGSGMQLRRRSRKQSTELPTVQSKDEQIDAGNEGSEEYEEYEEYERDEEKVTIDPELKTNEFDDYDPDPDPDPITDTDLMLDVDASEAASTRAFADAEGDSGSDRDIFWEEEESSGNRREPSLDTQASFEDSLDDFSMSAGERIGAAEGAGKIRPLAQSGLGDEMGEDEQGNTAATPETVKSRSRFSIAAIGRRLDKARRTTSRSDDEESTESPRATDPIATRVDDRSLLIEEENHLQAETPEPAAAKQKVGGTGKETAQRPRGGGEKVAPSEPAFPAEPSEVLVLNVMAREGGEVAGDDLLEALITSGLKFGDMNIFHKRTGAQGKGPAIFSVANILNPGTFDLNTISEFSTLGVSLFMALPTPVNNLEAFEVMISTARKLQAHLNAELRDDHRNMLTAQTIEHYRQRIRDFELRQLKVAGSRA